MKIFGICLVKDESDIIEYSLNEQSKWADKIFVYDNGSSDSTWDLVNRLSETNPKVVPFKSEAKPFRDGLRSEVYNYYKHLAMEGDWWCVRCDPDEFYIDNPREILPNISRYDHCVSSIHFEFGLTEHDIESINFERPIENILPDIRTYKKKQTSEIRFVRHRMRLKWPINYSYPKQKGLISPIQIRVKHYQYRSPSQIERRLEVRKQALSEGYKNFARENVSNWKEKLLLPDDSIQFNGEYVVGYIADPNLRSGLFYLLKRVLHFFKILP